MDIGLLIGEGKTAEVYEFGQKRVVKLFKSGYPSHLVESDYLLSIQAQKLGLPVPAVFEPAKIGDRTGLVFERINGQTVTCLLAHNPQNLLNYAMIMAELHAVIHSHQVPSLPFFLCRLEQALLQQEDKEKTANEILVSDLRRLADGQFLCHGDFHPDNIIMADHGPVIIDWGNSGRGCPAADAGTTSLGLKIGKVPANAPKKDVIESLRFKFQEAYLNKYLSLSSISANEIMVREDLFKQFLRFA